LREGVVHALVWLECICWSWSMERLEHRKITSQVTEYGNKHF
jgi:hypothetical protein